MNLERLRVKPAEWHPRWWDRPVTLLLVLVSWYMVVDGLRMLAAGHWWGVYAFVVAPCTVVMMRADVALQRASERDRAAVRDKRIAELENDLGIQQH